MKLSAWQQLWQAQQCWSFHSIALMQYFYRWQQKSISREKNQFSVQIINMLLIELWSMRSSVYCWYTLNSSTRIAYSNEWSTSQAVLQGGCCWLLLEVTSEKVLTARTSLALTFLTYNWNFLMFQFPKLTECILNTYMKYSFLTTCLFLRTSNKYFDFSNRVRLLASYMHTH